MSTYRFCEMQKRLETALRESGRSARSVCAQAGLNPGYLNGILTHDKEPTISNLSKICDALGVSLAFMIQGHEISREEERLLSLLPKNPESRERFIELLNFFLIDPA